MSDSSIDVVIVTYNSASVIGGCLGAVLKCELVSKVVVVDNGSSDGTVEIVRRRPGVTLIEAGGNLGFARGVNLGASQIGAKSLLLLNPDVALAEGALEEMHRLLHEHPTRAVVGPLVRERAGDRMVPAGLSPTLARMFLHLSGLSRLSTRLPCLTGHYLLREQATANRDVDWVTGACLLVKGEVWHRLGGLSERWFMYAEDIEFCLRVRSHGLRVFLAGTVAVDHAAGRSAAGVDGRDSSTWLLHLYELYRDEISPSEIHSTLWRVQAALGYGLRGLVSSGKRAQRFTAYARAIADYR